VDAAVLIRRARLDAGLTLRDLARRASTSHSTLAAYESGRSSPTASTLDRVLRAAGYAVDVTLTPRSNAHHQDANARGAELVDVLELAAQFPARHSATLTYPIFGAA